MTTNELVAKVASQLGLTEEQASSMIRQEQSRRAAGERYRQSEAYKLRLKQQKAIRAALKAVEAS